MEIFMTRRVCAVLSSIVASLGCYTYAPATLETVQPGAKIRAVLSTEAQADLARRVGLDTRELEGELVDADATTVLIAVKVPAPPTGLAAAQELRQRIDVPRRDVLRVDERKLDGTRTGLLMGGFAAAATVGVVLALEGGGPGNSTNGPPPPPERRARWIISVPVIRW